MPEKHMGGWPAIIAVSIGTFMTGMDINVVNIALPLIQKSFHTGISTVQWIAVSYLLVLCSTQLAIGRLSDLYSLKRIYISGFIGFTISSLLCGVSSSIGMLIAFRVLEALFGAMMSATSTAIVTNSVTPENRGKAMSSAAIAVAASTTVGPPLGGLLAANLGWGSIFLINVPIGIVGTILPYPYGGWGLIISKMVSPLWMLFLLLKESSFEYVSNLLILLLVGLGVYSFIRSGLWSDMLLNAAKHTASSPFLLYLEYIGIVISVCLITHSCYYLTIQPRLLCPEAR